VKAAQQWNGSVYVDPNQPLLHLARRHTEARIAHKKCGWTKKLKNKAGYGQPGLLCTPRNFAQSSKFLGKKLRGTKITSEAFLSIFLNLKVTRLQGGAQTKL
jgi:hypothetical protein